MTDEQALIAAYAEAPNDLDRRLVLADFFDERGDPRGTWLRDRHLAPFLGPSAEHPGERLVQFLVRGEEMARPLLVRVGPSAVPALWDVARLSSPSWEWEGPRCAAGVIDAIRVGVPGLTDLCEQMASDDPAKRLEAVRAVGDLGEPGVAALPELVARLTDESEEMLHAVVAACGRFERSAVAALQAVWWVFDIWSVDGTCASLLGLGRVLVAIVAERKRLSDVSDPGARHFALQPIGIRTRDLLALTSADEPGVRTAAAWALGDNANRLDRDAPRVADRLAELLADSDVSVRQQAVESLDRVRPHVPEADR